MKKLVLVLLLLSPLTLYAQNNEIEQIKRELTIAEEDLAAVNQMNSGSIKYKFAILGAKNKVKELKKKLAEAQKRANNSNQQSTYSPSNIPLSSSNRHFYSTPPEIPYNNPLYFKSSKDGTIIEFYMGICNLPIGTSYTICVSPLAFYTMALAPMNIQQDCFEFNKQIYMNSYRCKLARDLSWVALYCSFGGMGEQLFDLRATKDEYDVFKKRFDETTNILNRMAPPQITQPVPGNDSRYNNPNNSNYNTCRICGGSGICTSCGGTGGEWRDTGYYTGSNTKSWIDCGSCRGSKQCFNCFGTGRQ